MIEVGEDQETIYVTKGDTPIFNKIAFYLPMYDVESKEVKNYTFQLDDKISFIVKEKKGYNKKDLIRIEKTLKQMGYEEPTEYPELIFTNEDLKAFYPANKAKTYWYDIVLNDTTTVIGYDENGAKKIIVYPEGGERSNI